MQGVEAGHRRVPVQDVSGEGRGLGLLEWPKKLSGPVRCAYESGCTGFWPSRLLGSEGLACEVTAVSALPRSPKNKRHRLHGLGGLERRESPPGQDRQGGQLVFAPRARRGHLVDVAPGGAREAPAPGARRVVPGRGHGPRGKRAAGEEIRRAEGRGQARQHRQGRGGR